MKSRLFIFFCLFFLILQASPVMGQQSIEAFSDTKISIATSKKAYPHHFADNQGEAVGSMIDLWRLWAQKQGVEVEFIPLDWAESLEKVKSGEIDIHAMLAATTERQKVFEFSRTLFTFDSHFYLHQDLTDINSADQLSPYSIGLVKGSSHIEHIKKLYPNLVFKTFTNNETLYQAVLDKDILVFAQTGEISDRSPNYQQLKNLYPSAKRLTFHRGNFSSAVVKGNHQLSAFIDQGFARITKDERRTIERKWLGLEKQQDSLTLTFYSQHAPFSAVSPNGKPQGLFIDLWKLWSKQTGKNIVFIAKGLGESVDMVKQQEADVVIAFPDDANEFGGLMPAWHLYTGNSQVYITNRLKGIVSLADLAGKKLGVYNTAPYKNTIAEQYPDITLHYFTSTSEMIQAAEREEIDAMLGAVENLHVRLVQNNLQSSFYVLQQPIFKSPVYSLVNKENKQLAKMIKQGFEQIPVNEFKKIEERWLNYRNESFFDQHAQKVMLDEQQKNWLAVHTKIRVGMVKKWQPMEFIDKSGEFNGINRDIMDIISQRSGLDFEYSGYDSWQLLYQALLDKKVDMVGSAEPTAVRKNKLLFSDAYWELPWVILHQRHLGVQSSIEHFYGKQLAIVKGYHLISFLRQNFPQITLKLVDNGEDGLLAVQKGLVDGFIETIAAASELIKRESLVTLMISVVDEHTLEYSHIATRIDWPELHSIINQALLSISQDEKDSIYEKWFGIKINTGLDKSVVMRVTMQIAIIILIVLGIIVVWNRRLKVEINHSKALKVKMNHMATHDDLTGLANRVLLKDRISMSIAHHQRQKAKMAVLFIDLDGFKTINDSHGHNLGDELLIQLARRLETCVRKSDTVVRFGGDEFVVLLTDLHQNSEAAYIASKILKRAQQSFELSTVTAHIGCSIGIAMYPADGLNETDLLKVADTLMYEVKGKGKNHFRFSP
jgi:diguanylate cyclase (GGDEF)-like protein